MGGGGAGAGIGGDRASARARAALSEDIAHSGRLVDASARAGNDARGTSECTGAAPASAQYDVHACMPTPTGGGIMATRHCGAAFNHHNARSCDACRRPIDDDDPVFRCTVCLRFNLCLACWDRDGRHPATHALERHKAGHIQPYDHPSVGRDRTVYFVVEGATQQELTGNYYKVDDMVKNGRSVYTNSFAAVFWGGSVWHMHVAQMCFFESPADVTPGLLEAVPVEGQWHPTTRRQGGADFSRLPPTIVHVGQPRLRPPDFVVHGCTGQHRVFNGAYAAAGRFRGHPMFRHVAATKRSCVMLCQDGRYELRRAERMQLGPVVAVAQKGIRPDHAQWRAIGENHSADHIAVASPTPSCPTALLPWAKQQFHQACRGGKVAAVQALVRAMDNEALHATLNRLSVDGRTPLMLACEHGHLEVVKELCDPDTVAPHAIGAGLGGVGGVAGELGDAT